MLRPISLLLGAIGAASIASAQVTPVCVDTFEFPVPGLIHGVSGGTGWSNLWWVTGAMNDDLQVFDNTTGPMFSLSDGVGGHAAQVVTFGQAWRRIDVGAHLDLYDPATDRWGRDGATIWVSFSTQRFQGTANEHYGGLSLWKMNAPQAEALFIGSPWDQGGWGIDDEGGGGAPAEVIAGTDDSLPARLVTRIDFLPGDERVRMWVNPNTPYPVSTPDLDTTVIDLRFDEIRISSGGNNDDLFFFDAIEIAKGEPTGTIGTSYCTAVPNSTGTTGTIVATGSQIVASNDVTLVASDLPNTAFGFFLTSQTQAFVPQPGGSQGNLCLGGAIGRYVGPGQIQNTGQTGSFSLLLDLTQVPTPVGPTSVLAGETWNFQAWYRDAVGGTATSNFTDGVEIPFV